MSLEQEIARALESQIDREDARPPGREIAYGNSHPGFVSGVDTANGVEDSEFILWNYAVGSTEPRPQHNVALARVGPVWRRRMAGDPGLRIKVVGAASQSSGNQDRNRVVALGRVKRVAQILTNVFSIPSSRIDVESTGADLPLADEMNPDDPMNMARDRRVELFLHAPARLVSSIEGVSVPFSRVTTNLDRGPNLRSRNESKEQIHAERSLGIQATGRATWNGPPSAQIGFLQLVVSDVRRGLYLSNGTGKSVTVDLGRCTTPFLPCFDGLDSAQPLSLPGERGTGGFQRVAVPFSDAPGVAAPANLNDPIAGACRLVRILWSMSFALVFGVRLRDQFLPIEHVLWRASSTRRSLSGLPVPRMIAVRTGGGPGAPPGVAFARAMLGASCRLRTRSMDLCPDNQDPGKCPPQACAGAVARL